MRTQPHSCSRKVPKSGRLVQLLSLLALTSLSASAAPATIERFSGGDPGEGLDMQGNFVYALNIGPSGAAGKVGDADFTADNVTGVSITAGNQIGTGGWLEAYYGDTESDMNLATVMNSIRWAAAPAVVTVRLAVIPGNEYKLQLLFGEDCCQGRGFNVIIDGTTEARNLMPARIQMADTDDFFGTKENFGAVLTKVFVATSSEAVIVLSGPAADLADINDRNAILNGLTLEFLRVAPLNDTDSDSLPDEWETRFFTNLTQTATADFDTDGLTNGQENDRGTDPTRSDSDGDGLSDGAEVNTHSSDPVKVDSDGDGLRDGVEVNVHQTNPGQRDSDSDSFSDWDEIRLFSDAKSAQSTPKNTTIGLFTGGNPGEGLDLQGTIVYALDNAAEGAVGGQILDASFTPEGAEGTTVISGNKTGVWNGGIVYGDTPEDVLLAEMMSSISWSDWNARIPDVTLNFSNLVVGASYKIQLLFAEQAWPRGFDVAINGARVADDFSPVFYQGGGFPLAYPDDRGVVLTHTFVARTNNVNVILDGRGTTTPEFTDHNAIINAVTLELLNPPADSDGDSLPDAWETNYFGNLTQTGGQDPDGDTLPNATELVDGTNPSVADSDQDGLNDAQEKTAGTKSYLVDTDYDGLTDGAEVNTHQTEPVNHDTDSDGVLDGAEITAGRDPKRSETRVLVRSFSGGDAGEGLDLDGTFLYAFSVGTENPAGQVRDASFTGQTVDGVTILQAPSVIETYYAAAYGDTPNDDVLELAMQSIRHGGGGARIIFSNLVAGSEYKVQMLFGESGSARGFDVFANGKLIVDDFAPFIIAGGHNQPARSAVVSYSFIASTNTAEIRTAGTVSNPRYGDRNPIINAVTLEQVAPFADTDSDGISDPWERFYFNDLSGTATADSDNDGLNNLGEYRAGTDPQQGDADGDGLNDGGEVAAGSNPNAADTDLDGLNDGVEVNTHQSSPTSTDTDRDGFPDAIEVARGSNPGVADGSTTVGGFTGGDVGEGLDLDGNFVYAFSILPDTGAVGTVRDATFTSENVEGVTIAQAPSQIPNWYVPEFGSTPNDDALEAIVQNIRHGGGGATITLSNLVAGKRYKVQLLFGEACCSRAMDISVDGTLIADEFAPFVWQGGINNPAQGAVVAHEFTASSDSVVIRTLGGSAVTTPRYNDPNPIINAVTLEDLGAAPATISISAFTRTANGFSFTFNSENGRTYVLEYKERLADQNWQQAGTVVASGATTTLADDNAAHRTPGTGFWRIRGN